LSKELKKIAESLFGRVKKNKASGGHIVDPEKILSPFEHPDAVIHQFCRGCGVTMEVPKKVAEREADIARFELPSDIEKGMYFESKGCEICNEEDKSVKIKKLVDGDYGTAFEVLFLNHNRFQRQE